ncbi:AHH domain-containing protein [Adlercreutzia sp. R25]|uniref:AHH domain-containing protein n=1 Tax=Adlercreutzia shanghongiae TaxID=3111773 RepID=A0ABU6IZZ9_9ACTN|nr:MULTISPECIES: AHH domain-containing protein [unclassified Adlercreutzia]MEC4272974.1 AHH domain-containing protein [Adlercreutzia sp. R25]MEC4295235.1 AHH domain-containing protein [Adlercreutzia sp. R22]
MAYGLEGDYTNMAISAVAALLPYGGDLLKGGRLTKSIANAALDAFKESSAALRLGLPASSKVLGRNMKEIGISPPSSGYAAHHIVAGGAEKAEEARRILKRWGIDINSPANGVFLPAKKEIVSESIYHPGLHTNKYYYEINRRLSDAADSKEGVLQELAEIRNELLAGTFDYK